MTIGSGAPKGESPDSARSGAGDGDEMRPGLAERAGDHFTARDAPAHDRTEIWGRRIGRILSLLVTIALAVYLLATYL